MTEICLGVLRRSLEGVVASVLATCDSDGVPNVSMISQVHYVDRDRVALSYQFFNKTRRNLLQTRQASVQIVDPETFAHHRMVLDYERTQTAGPVFESMKAKLAGIASHHGMENVFRLLGADIFRVRAIEAVSGPTVPLSVEIWPLLAATRRTCAAMDGCADLEELLDCVTIHLNQDFGICHSMILMVDDHADRLYTLASHGYAISGIGSEVAFGEGVIGVAARENVPIRIGHMTREYRYSAAVSDTARRAGIVGEERPGIPFPGLPAPRSQMAVPISAGAQVLGVLLVEAEEVMRFGFEEEDALSLVAGQIASRIALMCRQDLEEAAESSPAVVPLSGVINVRFHPFDQSVFFGNDYLIKGVAGAILWRLVREHVATGRTEFTLRELRLDATLRLPAHAENLDARLILLRKRLEERSACLRIEKGGRGRFHLVVTSRITLEEIGDPERITVV